jgi:hypothetical protein
LQTAEKAGEQEEKGSESLLATHISINRRNYEGARFFEALKEEA